MKVKAVNVDNLGTEHLKITPVQAETPVEPIVPVEPVDPIEPVEPIVEPVDPIEPVIPVEPVEPIVEAQEELSQEKVDSYLKNKYNIESVDELLKNKDNVVPEDVKSFLNWKQEKGGGTMEEYITVTKDWTKASDEEVLSTYMKLKKPHLTPEELDFEINRLFLVDEDVDTESEVMMKRIAKKDFVKSANDFFEDNSRNYKPSRLDDVQVSTEYKEALDFKKEFDKNSEVNVLQKQRQRDIFTAETDKYFSNEFKGFEFKVGENESKVYQPTNVDTLKSANSDLTNMLGKYVDTSGVIKDVAGYHKAISIASDPDGFAKFFYEQGKSDGVVEVTDASKNRAFTPRTTHEQGGERSKIRKVDIDNSNYKFQLRVKQ